MADIGDRASAYEDLDRTIALRVATGRDVVVPREDGRCVDCDDLVESGRVMLGCGRCLACQKWAEQR